MRAVLRSGLKVWRSVAGRDSAVERLVRRTVRTVKVRRNRFAAEHNYAVFWSGNRRARNLGIFLMGSCDLPAIFKAVPRIQDAMEGTCAIFKVGNIADARSDVILQTLDPLPQEPLAEARRRLKLRRGYFDPVLFEPRFRIAEPGFENEEFNKDVVILSSGADAARTVYRHKEHGFLVDPGGWWLDQSKEQVLKNLDTVKWFRANFESVGRITPEQFYENYSRIIPLIRKDTDAHILMFNTLTVEPGNRTHSYQLIKDAHSRHRRQINLALIELSRQFDISIVDVDRVLKRLGLSELQVDFAHYPPEMFGPVADEIFRLLSDRGVF